VAQIQTAALEHRDIEAEPHQPHGDGEAGNAGPDDGDAPAAHRITPGPHEVDVEDALALTRTETRKLALR
jgi:hypothetical protein